MKSLKLWVGMILLGITATACSKSKGGGAAAPPAEQNYYLENGICYDKNDNRVDYSYCQDDDGNGSGPYNDAYNAGRCVGYIYYADCNAGKGYRINCSRSNSLAVECADPEAYAYPHEVVDCTYREYSHTRYCGGSVQY